MATADENRARLQEIADRGLQDRLPADQRARFDEATRRGLIRIPAPATARPAQPQPGVLDTLSEGARQFNIGVMEPFGLGDIPAQGAGTERPDTGGMGAARMVGNAAGTTAAVLAPAVRLATASRFAPAVVPGATSTGRQLLTEIGETALQRPGAFWSMEMIPAAASGAAGAEMAAEGASPTAVLTSELVAGLATSVAAPLAAAYAKISPLASLGQNLWRAFRGSGEAAGASSARSRAITRLSEVEPDPRAALQKANEADVLSEAPLTLAELSESPGLLALQRSIADSSDQLSQANQARFADINRVSQEALTGLGEGPSGPVNVEESRAFLANLVEERIRIARAAVDEKMEALGTNATNASASNFARIELEKAYGAALDQQDELWKAVGTNESAPFRHSLEAYKGILQDLSQDRIKLAQGLIPERVQQTLGRLVTGEDGKLRFRPGTFGEKPPTVRELISMRQELNDFVRAERAKDAPNRNAIRIADIMQESILADIAELPEQSEQLRVARAFSKDLNERFRQGEVGTLMGFDIEGGQSVPGTLTLERTLGLSGARGRVGAQQLLEAVQRTGNSDEMRGHMQDFLRYEFDRAAMKGGELDPVAAGRYLQRRHDVLQLFPELRRDMTAAVASGQRFRNTSKMRDPDLAAAALVTSRAPGTEIDRILNSSNPQAVARELRGLLDQDDSGRALVGMQNAAAERLLSRSLQLNATDASDVPFASGRRLADQLQNPAVRGALGELFTPEQLERMDTVAETLRKLDLSRAASPSQQGIIADREALLFNFARRLGAAALGSKINQATGSGGNIQIPGMVVQVAGELRKRGLDPAKELLVDAMIGDNPNLLRGLMLDTATAQQGERTAFVHRQMNAWAAAVAAKYGMDFSDESQRYQPGSSFDPGDLPVVR